MKSFKWVDHIYSKMRYRYFDIYFYQYLFRKADNPGWCSDNKFKDFWNRLQCRWRNHPCGYIFYNPGAYEPDVGCIDCGDEIG